MKTTIFKFILFFLAGVILISFCGFIYMLFSPDYSTGQRIGAIATTIIAGGAGYYILKQLSI
tara:strand:- start:2216 stop:2401 length:186 start_codon:yes stop_codon:yes gene_type:complete